MLILPIDIPCAERFEGMKYLAYNFINWSE